MDVSSAFHRCLRQALSRSAHCRHIKSSTTCLSISPRQQITRISHRNLASTSQARQQGQPPQPVPVSNHKDAEDAVGVDPLEPQQPRYRDPSNRIDLSSLPNIPPDYTPPPPRRQQSAGDKLNDLFGARRKRDTGFNPFARTIQQTDAANPPSTPVQSDSTTLDITKLFSHGPLAQGPPRPDTDYKLPLRLRPTLGRIQAVDPSRGLDLAKSFRLLEAKCTFNNIKADMRNQRFHVRKGQAKKLRRIANWRKAFKAGFLEECARVRRMKNQGW